MSKEAVFNVEHDEVQLLLPWFVTGQLAPDQIARVKDHLRHCDACSADLGWESTTHAAMADTVGGHGAADGLDAEAALARLMPRLDTPRRRPAPVKPSTPLRLRGWLFGNGWMPWALAGQTMLVAALAMQRWPGEAEPYRALGAEAHSQAGNVVVVFDPDTRLAQVQRIMQASGARIVDGPTVTGAYMLAVPPERQSAAIAQLKAQAGVRLAEPLTWRAGP